MRRALAAVAAGLLLDHRGGLAAPENALNEAGEESPGRAPDPALLGRPAAPPAAPPAARDAPPAPERRSRDGQVQRPAIPGSSAARVPRKLFSPEAQHRAGRTTPVNVSTEEEIVNLGRAHYDNFVIVTAANYAYRDILVNWMASVQKLRIDNYVVLCLDDQLALFMDRIGRPCIHGPSQGPGHIWLTRFQTARILLDGGMNVLMSDTDAIWLKDPTDLLQGDIVASRGNMPEDVASRYGATACMGFIYFHSVVPVRMLVDEIVDKGISVAGKNFDDQIELNKALVEHDMKFPEKLDFKHSEKVDYGSASVSGNMTIRIAMLDSRRFRRFTQPNDDVYIEHLGSAHVAATKEGQLKASGLWYLRENWESQTDVDMRSSASHGYFDAWIEGVQILSP